MQTSTSSGIAPLKFDVVEIDGFLSFAVFMMRNGQATRNLEAATKRRRSKALGDQSLDRSQSRKESAASADGEEAFKGEWHQEERDHHKTERFYWRMTGALTAIAALGAIASVILSQRSLQEARLATQEAHRQADIAKRALIENDRPIIVTQMQGVDLDGKSHSGHPSALASFVNYGSKPAFLNLMLAETRVQNTPFEANRRCFAGGINHIILGDRASNTWACDDKDIASPETIKNLESGVTRLYFFVTIYYTSARGSKWRRIDKSFYDINSAQWIDVIEDGIGTDVLVDAAGEPAPDP